MLGMWWLVGMKKAVGNRGISAPLVFFQMLFTVRLVFFFVEEEVFVVGWVIRPNIFYRFVGFTFVFYFLEEIEDEEIGRAHV